MAVRRSAAPVTDPHDAIIAEYRELLGAPAVAEFHDWEPVILGPTWRQVGGFWDLPETSIGWHGLAWCGRWLQHEIGRPWRFTPEQARWWLWWYAVDDNGTFLYRDGVLQRLKGWGKDPLGACLCANEAFGPSRFDGWGDDGQPMATDCPDAWIQTAAVSLKQTKNTMRLFPRLFTAEAKSHYGIQVGKELIHGMGDERLIEAVTSSPTTLEGARATFVLRNETHHWLANNDGVEMQAVIDRNAAKSAGGAARALSITNAYEPGEDSVAQRAREAWEAVEAGRAVDTGLLYDSLEAPPDAPLALEREEGESEDQHRDRVRSTITAVVDSIRGDSYWLDPDRIVKSVLDSQNPPSQSRRFWFNQITATEDAWLTPQEWDRIAAVVNVADQDEITLGFDGSKSDDESALIGCHVATNHLFVIGIWAPDKATNLVDRSDIDLTVRRAFDTWDVVGFYSDLHPWESYVDRWAEELAADLIVKAGTRHPIAWDMRARTQEITQTLERFHDGIVEQSVSHDGDVRLRQHFHNARRAPNRFGIAVRKEHRESTRKIDSVLAGALAFKARSDYLALPESRRRRKRTGRASFF